MSTRLPSATPVTAAPTSSTVPTASCPRIRPFATSGTSPFRMCRSVPQIVTASTRTMASRGSCISGSATSVHSMAPGPPYTRALHRLVEFAQRGRGQPQAPGNGEGHPKTRSAPIRSRSVKSAAGDRLRDELDGHRAGQAGPRHGLQPELRVRRSRLGIEEAESAVHQHAPGDPEVTCVMVDLESDGSIDLGQPARVPCGLVFTKSRWPVPSRKSTGRICTPAGDTNPIRPTVATASSS